MSIEIRKDLRHLLGSARDQKQRPTCMAFASSDVHASVRGVPFEELSTEFAYYHAAKRRSPFSPGAGVSMTNMLDAIREDGQPLESGWPYLEQLPADLSMYVPPAQPGDLFRRTGSIEQSLDVAIARLDQGLPVVLAMEISIEFYMPQPGIPIRAALNSPTVGRHAIAAVGHGIESREQVFLIRNSWGTAWGDQGHAWISRHYLQPRLMSIGAY
ncbi:MAG: C1 family peptidase [Bryobacteraceae bacterium]